MFNTRLDLGPVGAPVYHDSIEAEKASAVKKQGGERRIIRHYRTDDPAQAFLAGSDKKRTY